MTAQAKTADLLRLKTCPLGLLQKSKSNPNKMKAREFDLLIDNMNLTGWTDPVLARPLDLAALGQARQQAHGDEEALVGLMLELGLTLRIVGGHHRYDAAVYLGFDAGPVTVIMDPGFDDDAERFQMVRMNTIRGRMDPQAFFDLYQQVSDKYSDAVLQDAFGFAEEAEFKRLVEQTAASIADPVMKDKFKEAAREIKTIDGLSRLLNELFSRYGDTLPYAFMVFDYGGQRSVWLQVSEKTIKAFDVVGELCREHSRTVDDLVGGLLQSIAQGELQGAVAKLVATTPAVKLPAGLAALPTKQNIEQVVAMDAAGGAG